MVVRSLFVEVMIKGIHPSVIFSSYYCGNIFRIMRLITLLVLVLVMVSSCQKETDPPPVPDPALPDEPAEILSPDNGGLLKRQVWIRNQFSDSFYVNYVYDEEDRLIEWNQHLATITQPKEEEYTLITRFFYGDNGMVRRVTGVYRSPDNPSVPDNSSETYIFHDAATGRYTYALTSGESLFYDDDKDSTVFFYDSQERINATKIFDLIDGNIQDYVYTYDGNDNVTSVQRFFNSTLSSDHQYQYDDKINPEAFGDIGVLIIGEGIRFAVGKNNYISMKDEVGNASSPTRNFIYNAHNKPAEATLTYDRDPGAKGTLKYLYAP